jgi:hypothetical protein
MSGISGATRTSSRLVFRLRKKAVAGRHQKGGQQVAEARPPDLRVASRGFEFLRFLPIRKLYRVERSVRFEFCAAEKEIAMNINSVTHANQYPSVMSGRFPAQNKEGKIAEMPPAAKNDAAYVVKISAASDAEQAESGRKRVSDKNSPDGRTHEAFTGISPRREAVDGSPASADEGGFEAMAKCLTIARRIMRGDKVSNADIRFLMENNLELYSQAMLLRQQKEHAREYESISEDEKKSSEVSASLQTGMPAGVESANETVEPSPESGE